MSKINVTKPADYKEVFQMVKSRVYEAQYKAYAKVNSELISLYWDLGKTIVEKQEQENWGDATVEQLAEDLQLEFKGTRGFNRANMFRIRKFFLEYRKDEKVAQLVRQIGWSHNILIMQQCKDAQEREFYIRMTIKGGWSRSTLKAKIANKEFEKWALSQNNFRDTLPDDLARKGEAIVKDDYNLDFLEITSEIAERSLEQKIIEKVDHFIKQMNGRVMFAGRQVRLEVGEKEYFVDLLFYHKQMHSYIVIELKTGEFLPEYAGKMSLYLGAVESLLNDEGDSPAIGFILCREKDRAVVETTLKVIARPIGVSTYKTYTAAELPTDYAKYLPSQDELEERLLALVE